MEEEEDVVVVDDDDDTDDDDDDDDDKDAAICCLRIELLLLLKLPVLTLTTCVLIAFMNIASSAVDLFVSVKFSIGSTGSQGGREWVGV